MVAMFSWLLSTVPPQPPSAAASGSVLSGTWELLEPRAATAAVEAGLDAAVADFNFLTRGFARQALAQTLLPVPTTMVLDVDGPQVDLQWQGRPAVIGPVGTHFVGDPDGAGAADVVYAFDGVTFIQRAAREQGVRTTTVTLADTPTGAPPVVVVVVRIESGALRAPLTWTHRFRRRGV